MTLHFAGHGFNHGGVWLHIEEGELPIGIAYHGRVVAGITIFEQIQPEIKTADEHRDEHALLVVLARQQAPCNIESWIY